MNDTCPTCGLSDTTVAVIQHCGLKREPKPDDECVWRSIAPSEDRFRVTYRYRDGSESLHEHLMLHELPGLWFKQDWRSITGATIERET